MRRLQVRTLWGALLIYLQGAEKEKELGFRFPTCGRSAVQCKAVLTVAAMLERR